MTNKSHHFDATEMDRLLMDEISESERAVIQWHVSACETCRQRLDDRAAEQSWWNEASRFLQDDESDLEPLSDCRDDISATSSIQHAESATLDPLAGLLAPTDDPRMLGRLGTYEIVGLVGSGGMGAVLKGFDSALNRYVAIKILAPHLASSGAARKRFAREAAAAAAVVHENVIEIHGVAEAQGSPYIVMPYVRGASLQRRLDDHGPLSVIEILRIGMQIAAGLAAAHSQGLVHRDIKPANILLAEGVERVTITDFGLARAADDASLTLTGLIAGTPQYMSPEQARGDSVDFRSDLFSLGSVLYAACTGRPPFRAENSYGVLSRISDLQPQPIQELNPEIPDWLCRLIRRLHSKPPADRYQSADELAALLGKCLAHVQQPSTRSLPESLWPRSKVQKWLWPLAAGMIIVASLTLQMAWKNRPSSENRNGPGEARTVDDSTEPRVAKSDLATPDGHRDETTISDNSSSNQSSPPTAVGVPGDAGETDWNDGVDESLLQIEASIRLLEQSLNAQNE